MAKTNDDAPPTVAKPKTEAAKKAASVGKLAELKKKEKANRPAAKLTYGATVNGEFQFVKKPFDDQSEAMNAAIAVFNKMSNKGLREIIISFHTKGK
jgi:hypothetical protein